MFERWNAYRNFIKIKTLNTLFEQKVDCFNIFSNLIDVLRLSINVNHAEPTLIRTFDNLKKWNDEHIYELNRLFLRLTEHDRGFVPIKFYL